MASSRDRKVNYGRRFFWFALAIVVAGALYSAGWFYAADRLVEEVQTAVAAVNRDGRRANCENPEARGYPFRIGVFCRSVLYEDARGGISVRARQFRSAAQVYQPFHVIGELDSPAALEAPGLASLEFEWASLRGSARLASPLPERVSIESKALVIRLNEPGSVSPLLAEADTAELHMRPAGEGLDLAARFAGLRLDPELVEVEGLPALSGVADIWVSGTGPGGLRGRSGTIRNLTVSLGEESAGITIAGPVSVDDDGLVDAKLEVTLRDPQAFAAILGELLPEQREQVEAGLSSLAAMGDTPTLPLRIHQGEISLGFLSLGSIPAL